MSAASAGPFRPQVPHSNLELQTPYSVFGRSPHTEQRAQAPPRGAEASLQSPGSTKMSLKCQSGPDINFTDRQTEVLGEK